MKLFFLSFFLSFMTASVFLLALVLFPGNAAAVSPIPPKYRVVSPTYTETDSAGIRGSDAVHSQSTRRGW